MKKSLLQQSICTCIMLAMLSVIISCKKNDQSGGTQSSSNSIKIPRPGAYTYHVHSSDGTDADMINTISNQRDSGNGKLETIVSVIDTSTTTSFIYADATNTSYWMNPPATFWSALQSIRSQPGVTSVAVNGWPMFMTMKNQPVAGDALVFTGGPVTIHIEGVQDNMPVVDDWTMKYQNGSAIALNQSITTDAGTFVCTEWAYQVQTDFTAQAMGQTFSQSQILKDTVWYAPEVGMVKSRETSPTATSETTLEKIQ